ncbi:hypothetical protein [Xanthomonas massiliensis]|jgi:hypothetical protein|uniref:hypothetical protein n=1 Tax=Xanthomonas massiliensis TaxID=1720302 RepID=UPI000826D276|nr:hypothetical protein [Xanthomonas massiliensis]
MKPVVIRRSLGLALLLSAAGPAAAQTDFDCPPLPPGSGLQWQKLSGEDFLSCKALDADGHQALGVMLSRRDPKLSLTRDHRAERGQIEEEKFYWYVPDLAGLENDNSNQRVASVDLGKKRYAQIWIDARDAADRQNLQALAERLDLAGARTQVAGN